MCGTAEWQWREDSNAYVAVEVRCPGCAAKEVMNESLRDGPKVAGATVTLLPPAVAEEMATRPAVRPKSARERARDRRHEA